MGEDGGSQTLIDGVHARLRDEVLTGVYPPGHPLRLQMLSSRFSTSRSVVREALMRLTGEGLVTVSPQRGFRVTTFTLEDLKDLTRARVLIETMTLRESIRHGGLDWEASVVAAHHVLDRTPKHNDDGSVNAAWGVAHDAFHRSLLAGTGSPRLEAVAGKLRDNAQMFHNWLSEALEDRDRQVDAEHRAIVTHSLDRDEEKAAQALQSHIEATTRSLSARLASPDTPQHPIAATPPLS